MPQDSPHNGVPMLDSRTNDEGMFEPQRNLMRKTFSLDNLFQVRDVQGNWLYRSDPLYAEHVPSYEVAELGSALRFENI